MKRFQVLAIILLTGILLFAAAYYWPKDKLEISILGEGRSVKFMSAEELLDFKISKNEANVDSIINILESRTYGINEDLIKRVSILDESVFEESSFFVNPQIEGGKTALDNFFDAVCNEKTEVVRVGHYGDSQIEGDRMTSILRILFQGKFGGNGVGYVPIDDITSSVSYSRIASSNWTRHTVFTHRSAKGLYSPGGLVFKYRFKTSDSYRDSISENGDTIKIFVPGKSYNNASVNLKVFRPYNRAFIWYGNGSSDSKLKVYGNGSSDILAEITLSSEKVFNVVEIPLSSKSQKLRFVFSGPSPEIYGLAFDPLNGIQFDNFGLRGHSGDGLMSITQSILENQLTVINEKLAILQFGGNVTPYVKNESSLNNVKKSYDRLYRHFKAAMPNASVLVIGVNDVARSVGGQYASYPMVGRIRDVQKEVALKNGCAFFDLYDLMGGENSVIAWHKKNLASRDGHYSDRGREIVVNEIYRAIVAEYNKYLLHSRKK